MRKLFHRLPVFAAAAAAVVCLTGGASAEETGTQTGWITEGNRRAYLTEDGFRAVGTVEIDGTVYVFAPNGLQQVGWQDADGKRFYYDPETGEPVFGRVNWRGEMYYVTESAGKLTEQSDTEEGKIWPDAYGVLRTDCWIADGDAWYHADADGLLADSETVVDGVLCLFAPDGVLQTGFQTDSAGVLRYYDPDFDAAEIPLLRTGWFETGGDTYYLNADGSVQTGLAELFGDLYDFAADGKQCSGWQSENGNRYYFGEDAKAVRGLCEIGGDTYFFDENAVMQTGCVMLEEPYFFDADGRRIDGWHTTDAGMIYRDPLNGEPVTGWQTIAGERYYFSEAGIMAVGMQTIGDQNYRFTEAGIYHPVKICLDAGHYALYNQSPVNKAYWESNFSWKMHLYLKTELESYGIEVVTTRENQETDLGLETRGRASEGCDLFLSIHSNAMPNSYADGPLACCTVTGVCDELGLALANLVADVMQTNQRGSIWKRYSEDWPGLDYYGVLRGATFVGTPAILLEHSYHTNLRATQWLLIDSNLQRLAAAEAAFLADYFGMIPKTS